jgi:hypothetical protein
VVGGLGRGGRKPRRVQPHQGKPLDPGDGPQGVQAAVVLGARLDVRVDPHPEHVVALLAQAPERLQDADPAADVDENVHRCEFTAGGAA